MRLYFCGTKYGMTMQQKLKVQEFLVNKKDEIKNIRHGDLIGGDEEFHRMCYVFRQQNKITVHPPKQRCYRALCKAPRIEEPADSRNRIIIMCKKSDTLLATPHSFVENIRTGCWQAIRLAREHKLNIILVFPDGTIEEETKRCLH